MLSNQKHSVVLLAKAILVTVAEVALIGVVAMPLPASSKPSAKYQLPKGSSVV
jgi:hypothetical protein